MLRGLGVTTRLAARRFGEGDLVSILDHIEAGRAALDLMAADETHSAQPGTGSWQGFGR